MPRSLQRPGRKIRELLASEPVWAINPPAMAELMSLVEVGANVDLESLSAKFGTGDEPSRMERMADIAIIPITGMIRPSSDFYTRYLGATSLKDVERDLATALADSAVRQVVLYVNSPGGAATGNAELAAAIKAGRSIKPIAAFIDGMGASAAYWNASAAGKVYASPSAFVGSIGVIYMHANYAEALKDAGIEVTIVTHGARKGDGNPYRSLTGEALAAVQKQVADIGAQFDGAVAAGRGVSLATVREKFGQGQVFLAAEAQSRGLIDGVMTWAEFLRSIQTNSLGSQPITRSETPANVGAALSQPKEIHPMKVKAALYGRGLIASMDATDAEVSAALAGFFAGRGLEVPKTEAEQLAALNGTGAAKMIAAVAEPLRTTEASNPPGGQAGGVAPNVAAAQAREINEARAAERQRIADIRAAGARLGATAEAIDAAVADGNMSLEAFTRAQLAAAANTTHQPLNAPVRVAGEGADRFQADALAALSLRHGLPVEQAQRTERNEQMASAPLVFFAQQYLTMRGERLTGFESREEIALRALQMDGSNRSQVPTYGASINTPASFPTLMSALLRKIVVNAVKATQPRYEAWCGRYEGPLPDFKPTPIVQMSEVYNLDEIIDAEPFREIKLAEESLDYFQCGRYGDKIGLTPVMVANNETGTYAKKIRSLINGGARRMNKLCLSLLSKSLLDGIAVFHNSHANLVASGSGGVPSDDQWQNMVLKAYAQTPLVAAGESQPYADVPLSICLIPPALERAARRTFDLNSEVKQPATDATVNIYRGTVTTVVEPDLQAFSNSEWYGLCNPSIAPAFVYGFYDGYDAQGQSERWWDPNTKTWWYSVETRFGAAVSEYRNGVKNFGA
jgi:signal peptide peptidase SppA